MDWIGKFILPEYKNALTPEFFKFYNSLTAEMVTTWSGNPPPTGKAMLEHVVTVVLKHPKDGPLAKALDEGGIPEIMDVLTLNQANKVCPYLPVRWW